MFRKLISFIDEIFFQGYRVPLSWSELGTAKPQLVLSIILSETKISLDLKRPQVHEIISDGNCLIDKVTYRWIYSVIFHGRFHVVLSLFSTQNLHKKFCGPIIYLNPKCFWSQAYSRPNFFLKMSILIAHLKNGLGILEFDSGVDPTCWLCFPMEGRRKEGRKKNPLLTFSRRITPTCLNFGDCIMGVWRVYGNCLVGVWWVSGGCLKGVWKMPGGCLEGIYGMSEW